MKPALFLQLLLLTHVASQLVSGSPKQHFRRYILEPPPCRSDPENCTDFCTLQEDCQPGFQCCSAFCGIVCTLNKDVNRKRKCPVLALGVSGPSPLKHQAQNITSVDTKTLLLATGYTMKLIELGFLLGLFTSLLTTPLMGGMTQITDMICKKFKDRCKMPLNFGSCYDIQFRYFYNITSGLCESFVYTGCDGNLNNYRLKIECQMTCEKKYIK
nr:PREDICTED: kunitz-type protease inhibitor 4 [Bos mutus]